ncbi:unnamed protein product [Clonostachys rosea f. rosea IK726]|uniref:Uncharacterized protein n=1 Tax=Clonostachys rosea f. rosea IK726 TaxID=1349383 RepID=A0ACA9TG45_BIOOC|nr:unnamed protein product [Clonostachys rosea f. rosea IK726]
MPVPCNRRQPIVDYVNDFRILTTIRAIWVDKGGCDSNNRVGWSAGCLTTTTWLFIIVIRPLWLAFVICFRGLRGKRDEESLPVAVGEFHNDATVLVYPVGAPELPITPLVHVDIMQTVLARILLTIYVHSGLFLDRIVKEGLDEINNVVLVTGQIMGHDAAVLDVDDIGAQDIQRDVTLVL